MKPYITGFIVLSLVSLLQVARANELRSLADPVPVISGVRVRGDDVRAGGDFYATLAETVTHQGWALPEGTHFVGHLQPSSRLGVWIDQAIFPNGDSYAVYPGEHLKPQYTLKSTKKPHALVDAGDRIDLRFSPAVLRGMMQAAPP